MQLAWWPVVSGHLVVLFYFIPSLVLDTIIINAEPMQ